MNQITLQGGLRDIHIARPLSMRDSVPWPETMTRDLVWNRTVVGASLATANSVSAVTFSLNSAYDPLTTGAGDVQPYGYNSLALLYGNYIVESVHVTACFFAPSVNGVLVGLNVDGSSPSTATMDQWLQKPTVMYDFLSTAVPSKTFQIRVPIHVVVGLTRQQYFDQASIYGSGVGSAPSSNQLGYLGMVPPSNTQTCGYQLRLVYRVKFFNRATLASTTVA